MENTICVIDDDEISEKTLALILKLQGYKVFSANTANKALEIMEDTIPDLILLDIDMPEMSGLEFISIIKKKKEIKDIPVLFISAHQDVDTKVEGLRLGAIDFISKPFQNPEVVTRIKVHLENSLLQKQLYELNKKKNKFFSIIAKDMKEDLDQIFAQITSLEDFLNLNDLKSLKDTLTKLSKSNEQTKSYLRNLIYWSRLETKLISLTPTNINLSKIIKEVLKENSHTIEKKKITIQNSFTDNDIFAFGDEYSVKIILENLFSNAIKFTNYNEYIQINYTKSSEIIIISILNKGMFFSDELQEKILNFEYHSKEPLNETEKGSALGLTLSKEIVEKNNGNLTIATEGNITKISFTLPLSLL